LKKGVFLKIKKVSLRGAKRRGNLSVIYRDCFASLAMTIYSMEKHSLVRTIYLYLFAMVGLVLLIIACVSFLNMALKTFIFTKADEQMRIEYKQPSFGPIAVEKVERISQEAQGKQVQVTLAEGEVQQIDQWLADYKNYQEGRAKIDPVTTERQQQASINLAMIIIGLPLYLYHWGIIKRETRKQEAVLGS